MNNVNKSPSGSIKILAGPQAGMAFQISSINIKIGRDSSNDIVLTDPTVSRFHACIAHDGSQWNIEKIAANNSVTINRRDVQKGVIHNNDSIGLGPHSVLLFLVDSVAQYQPSPARQLTPMPPQRQTASQSEQDILFTERAPQTGNSTGLPSLEVSTNISQDKQVMQLTKQVIKIGRDPSNDIVVNAPIVSAFHAQIVRMGNDLIIVHPHPQAKQQRTLNGLLYQGQHIRGDEVFRKTLTRGDIFRIGDESGTLVTLTFNDGSGALQEVLPEIHPIPLGTSNITIGRHIDNMIVLKHPQVSAHHARLEQVQGGYRIIDLGSTNHVYVDTQRVANQLLKPADEIRIGPFKLIYTGTELTQYDESNSIRIDAINLKKVGNNATILLHDISLVIPPRKFVALVGGSGTGKTTLMDALNGLRPAQEGKVFYNGQNYYRSLAAFSTQLGYVPQDDIVHRDLTVERALYYAAKLRLPNDFTGPQIKQRIDEVLADVEMEDRRNLLVSKLSGGQRKRVSIALELLAKPSIFFLDEPTSGLDPGLDRKMMFLLRKLADKGHTIVLVTHATNNINACDYVCFLARGGRLAYYGPPNEAKQFFNKTDFAEIYSSLEPTEENPNTPAQAEALFRASSDYQKYVVDPLNQGPAGQMRTNDTLPLDSTFFSFRTSSAWRQFRILSRRYLELLKNDAGNLLLLLWLAPAVGLMFWLLTSPSTFNPNSIVICPSINQSSSTVQGSSCQDLINALHTSQRNTVLQHYHTTTETDALQAAITPGSGSSARDILFYMALATILFGVITGWREIAKEASIYRRERTVNLGILPYILSKVGILGPLCLLQCAVLILIVNLKAPFQQGIFLPPVLEIYVTLALTALLGLMIGLTISALVASTERVLGVLLIFSIPQLLFSGFFFPLNNWIGQILGLTSSIRWTLAALGSSIGLHSDKLNGDTLWGNDPIYHGTLFSVYSQADATSHLLLIWSTLIVMIIFYGLLTAYFLKRKDIRA